jgi:ABC-type uncharacterized transport system auxiliary subunit
MRPLNLLWLVLALCGCQTAPAPEDSFYRLLPVQVRPALPDPIQKAGLAVRPLAADSLYSERAIVYLDAERPRLLRQYHYYLWLYPPAELIQEQFAASLRQSNPGASIAYKDRPDAVGYAVSGRVLRFERVVAENGSKAVAELELTLESPGRGAVLLDKSYSADAPAPPGTINGFSQAMEQALAQIYAAFAADLQSLK